MIKSVTVTNYLGDQIKLTLTKPEETGLIITSITGLGPGKATINSTEMSTMDGTIYNSSRCSSRNIVISLRYLWKETIEEVRHLTYKYFPLKRKVTLMFETDERTSEIEGYVESNEPEIFSKEEGADISIVCPFPFFYSVSNRSTFFGGVEPLFEFPFSNESLTEPLIEFSEIRNDPERNIDYSGDVEIGVTISIKASGEASNIMLLNVTSHEVMRIDTDVIEAITGSGIVDKDEIIISTVKGQKSAVLVREGKTTNILNSIDRSSAWFQISKGDNLFMYSAEEGQNNLQIEIQNRVLYEGV